MIKKAQAIWLILLFVLAGGAQASTETDYMAIFILGKKVGSAVTERVVEGDIVTTTLDQSMTIGRLGEAVTLSVCYKCVETVSGQPLSFEMTRTTSGVEQKTTGSIKDGKLTIKRQMLGMPPEITIDWPQDAILCEAEVLRDLKERGIKAGDTFELDIFNPELLNILKAKITVGQKKNIKLLAQQHEELTEVKTKFSINEQDFTTTSYVDSDFKVKKSMTPLAGMTLEMVACDEAFAKQEDIIIDFLDKLSVASPVKLTNLNKIDSITYILKPTTQNGLTIPESSCQSVKHSKDAISVTVQRLNPPKEVSFPYEGEDPQLLAALASNDYIQSTDTKIIDMAKHAVGDAKDAAAAASRIEAFVDGYIKKKDLSVGYASAAEVAQNQQGDCSEHAVLTAAMCRAIGIPARIVCGVVYADSFLSKESMFGGHMWTEVYLGDGWYGLDATRSEKQRVGPGHIGLVYGNGEPADFFGLINTLGCFEIEKMSVQNVKDKKQDSKNI